MIPLANTGIDKIISIDVTIIDQQYKVRLSKNILFEFMFIIEIVKFIDLIIDDNPFRWREKIIKLIDEEFWIDRGGYKVHPVKILFFINILNVINIKDGNKIHILKLFNRG